jgi:CRP-like cAMP-binding protein
MEWDRGVLERMVRKLELRAKLSDGDRKALLALPHTVKVLEAATYLIREGDPPVHCAVVLTGFAYRQKITGEGGRQILGIHVPGDMLDLQNLLLSVSDHNVQTLTRAEVALIPRTALHKLIVERPGVAHALFIDTLVDASIFREWLLNVGRRDSRTRLAHLLCEFALRLEAVGLAEDHGYELPMTQEQLADATGLTPVHVNRMLKTLDAEGLVEREKRRVRIPDWQRMRHVADFSERYLHLDQRAGLVAI